MRRSQIQRDELALSAFIARGRVSSAANRKRKAVSPASAEQRERVRDRCCVNCGMPGCDPAHLCPRSLGGCDDALCVIPLCRNCHRAFDHGAVDLEPVIALRQFSEERAHMASHLSLRQCMKRLNGMAA